LTNSYGAGHVTAIDYMHATACWKPPWILRP